MCACVCVLNMCYASLVGVCACVCEMCGACVSMCVVCMLFVLVPGRGEAG